MSKPLRIVIADDERPARRFLVNLLKSFPDVEIVGEASTGAEAIELIETERPDLALLDLDMPESGGIDVARLRKSDTTPLIAFVTAHDDGAIQAFELNAVDYLLKPVDRARLAITISRARARAGAAQDNPLPAPTPTGAGKPAVRIEFLERIPVRRRDETVLLAVRQISSIVADGELLHFRTIGNERYSISHRLHALESRLDPKRFVRLNRGALAAVDQIKKVSPMPGGTYEVQMNNGEILSMSRIQGRVLRETLLRL